MRITEAQIRTLVRTFYAQVRHDPLVGPVFEARLEDDWEPHLKTMCDFWSTVLLASGRYRGNPMATHTGLPDLSSRHFDRWMELFSSTARDCLPQVLASDILGRASRMRAALQRRR